METTQNRYYQGIPIGLAVRGSIADTRTFRVRRGNGVYGAKLGKRYQDQYAYFIPSSINNVQSASRRTLFASAVYAWKNTLTSAEKIPYDKRASKGLHMSGYNLYIREVLTGKVVL